jgi:hypothetical protein
VRQATTNLLATPEFARSSVLSVTCVTSVCRVEVEHENDGALRSFLERSPDLAQGGGGMAFSSKTKRGSATTVAYLAPTGASLPKVD